MIGQDVIFRERVVTDASGQTQIRFLDQSSMSIGLNSDLVIDEFVYDPHASTGKLALSTTRGVFRYVGGNISKLEGAVTVNTPVGTIGVRGGINGRFFGPSNTATAPLETGGSFAFGSPSGSYLAAGVLQGHR